MLLTILSLIVLLLTFASFTPQIQHVWQRRDAKGISSSYLLFNLICATEHVFFGFFWMVNMREWPGFWTHLPITVLDWVNFVQLTGVWALFNTPQRTSSVPPQEPNCPEYDRDPIVLFEGYHVFALVPVIVIPLILGLYKQARASSLNLSLPGLELQAVIFMLSAASWVLRLSFPWKAYLGQPQGRVPISLVIPAWWRMIGFVAVDDAIFALGQGILLCPGPGYDTSTTLRLDRNATNAVGDGPFTASLRLVSTKLTRWDAIYFTEVASRDYIFEQEWAFGYGFTKLINFFANAPQKTGAVDCAFREHVAGILIAHAAHGLSVLVLYCLGCAIFSGRQGRMLAFIAACLHIFSPAGLFLSAPYGESTYALLSFAGYFLFVQSFSPSGASTGLKDALIPLAGILCGLATTVRSNGILSGLLFLEEAIRVLYSMTGGITFAKSRRLLAVGIAGVCTGLGFVIPQYIAYRDFCVNYPYTHDEEPRIWCRRTVPSIYSFVQDHYWNNGFLRYWTVSNIPLFALASPMLAIMTYSAFWTLSVQSGSRTGAGRLLRSLAAPQLILAILTLAKHHVQIITRMASGYPVWYFWIADLLMKEYSVVRLDKKEVGRQKQRSYASMVVTYMICYAAVQGVLFASFLPPA
ncbi:hypothetical protein CNMCM5878_006475 [Aspergillus fumigatiaffinis]|nr:hypothetical protein CNMCM5878_006475 [Aspergillus fumigatiaffinis]